MSTPPLLRIEGLCVRLGMTEAVFGLSLELDQGELGCLLGPSGCGKTTTLRTIAGLERPFAGRIEIEGREATLIPPERRPVGLVFQDLALFPHLTVAGNIEFGLHDLPRRERRERVGEVVALMGLSSLLHRYPHELSGGQQQRVAIARTLARRPRLLLLDEPFAALDAPLRRQLRQELRQLCKQLGLAALLVTHDRDEGFAFADRLGVMREGRLEQWNLPYELYHRPATPFVAEFVGEGRWLEGMIRDDGFVSTALGAFPLPPEVHYSAGQRVRLLVRLDDVVHDPDAPLRARVLRCEFRGAEVVCELELGQGIRLEALFPSHLGLTRGASIGIRLDLVHVITFPWENANAPREERRAQPEQNRHQPATEA